MNEKYPQEPLGKLKEDTKVYLKNVVDKKTNKSMETSFDELSA